MRLCSMSQRFVVLMAVLTLSLPSITLAQQNPEQAEVPASGATQDASTIMLEVEAVARLDASNDFEKSSKIRWFRSGIALPPLGTCIGGSIGCLADPPEIVEAGGHGALGCNIGKGLIPGLCIGLAVGGSLPFIVSAYHPPIVPPERLLGKSPEYVKSYSDAYKTKTRSLRSKQIVVGAAVGFGLSLIGCAAMIPSGL